MKFAILLLCSVLLASASAGPRPVTTRDLAQQLEAGPTDIIIRFASTAATLKAAKSLKFDTRAAHITGLRDLLLAFSNASQKNVLSFLGSKSNDVTQLWISNELYVKNADAQLVAELSKFPEIQSIRENKIFDAPKAKLTGELGVRENSVLAEWGIESIQANVVWTFPGGSNGTGVRVGTIDTGVRGSHEALASSFYGTYGWFDPYIFSTTPNDQNGHGTHITGTIAGANGIGVAPGAKWQSCKACDTATCTEAALLRCGQWILCPTLPNGASPDCSHAPHVVANGWAGGRSDDWFDSTINAWQEAGIVPVFGNGDSGPTCSTGTFPANSPDVIAVGSTTSANGVDDRSSRGPSAFGNIKPDISAPGNNIRSAYIGSDTDYAVLSGSSTAGPHVAGVVALLKGINENITFADVTSLLFENADLNLVPDSRNCGGIVDSTYPNHSAGYGKVNAFRAARALINSK